jgi:hypothetical protein
VLNLLWAIAVVFVVMWVLGFAFHFTAGVMPPLGN